MSNKYRTYIRSIALTLRNRSFWPVRPEVKGFSEAELVDLEKFLPFGLPTAYKEFLLAMGHSAGELFKDDNWTFSSINDLLELRVIAEELWSNLGYKTVLRDDDFVFSCYEGTRFSFFSCENDDENPIVFDYEAGYDTMPIKRGSFVEELSDIFKSFVGV